MESTKENKRIAQGLRLIAYSIIIVGGLITKSDLATMFASILFLADLFSGHPGSIFLGGIPKQDSPVEEVKEEE